MAPYRTFPTVNICLVIEFKIFRIHFLDWIFCWMILLSPFVMYHSELWWYLSTNVFRFFYDWYIWYLGGWFNIKTACQYSIILVWSPLVEIWRSYNCDYLISTMGLYWWNVFILNQGPVNVYRGSPITCCLASRFCYVPLSILLIFYLFYLWLSFIFYDWYPISRELIQNRNVVLSVYYHFDIFSKNSLCGDKIEGLVQYRNNSIAYAL